MNIDCEATCEWPGCERNATVMRTWGDTLLCKGHDMMAEANYMTHLREYPISVNEYRRRLREANSWLEENPA